MKYILTSIILLLMAFSVFTETIYEIQYTTDPSGNSPYVNETVTVSGVVTRTLSGRYTYIQDADSAWSGLLLYSTDLATSLSPGDSISVTGTVIEFSDKTEISPVDNYTLHKTGVDIPGPVEVTSGELNDEQWEGVFVIINNAVVTSVGSDEFNVDDGSGNVKVYTANSDIDYNPSVGDTLKYIQGIIDQYYSTYELIPCIPEDILKSIDGSGKANINPKYANIGDLLGLRLDIIPTVDTVYGIVGYTRIIINADTLNDLLIMDSDILDTTEYSVDYSDTLRTIIEINHDLIDTLHIYISDYEFAAEDSFIIYTGESAAYFQYISDFPYIKEFPTDITILDISEVQKTSDGYNSVYNNQTVTVKGIVTGPSAIFSPTSSSTGFWIADETGGINIYSSNDVFNTSFTLGMELVITGTITEYNGITELKYSTPEEDILILNDTVAEIEPTLLSNSQSINELNEGDFLKIEYGKIQTAPVDAGSGKNFQIYNGLSLIDVRIGDNTETYSNTEILNKLKPGTLINVIGIASQYDTEEPYSSGYQFLTRYDSDIEFLENNESDSFNVTIFPNPVNFDNGEIARIEIEALNTQYITARILDMRGRLIKTLVENVPGSQTILWNGTDFEGRKANIAAYILIVDMTDANGYVTRINKPLIVTTNIK